MNLELSHSLLQQFPCMWRVQWLLTVGRDQEENPYSSMGRNLHFGTALYRYRLLEKKRETDFYYMDNVIVPQLIANRPVDVDRIDLCMEVIRNTYKHDLTAEQVLIETRMAVDANLEPCAPGSAESIFAGTPDLVVIRSGGRHAFISDEKYGDRRYASDPKESAQDDHQLQDYAWLTMRQFPDVEEVTGQLHFVRWGVKNRLYGSWTREGLEMIVPERVLSGKAQIDEQLRVNGEDAWDCVPDQSVCKWCTLAPFCPASQEAEAAVRSLA